MVFTIKIYYAFKEKKTWPSLFPFQGFGGGGLGADSPD